MKNLLDIPLVNGLAQWIWSDDPNPNVSAERCMETLPFMVDGCWGRLIAKGLGIGIILGACVNKTPMIFNLYESKTTEGLSRQGLYAEVVLVANTAAYGMLEGHPFTSYGEVITILIQSVIIILLVWQYSHDPPVSSTERYMVALISVLYVVVLSTFLPKEWHFALLASSWPIMLYSRITQLWETYCAKHTGAQSGITMALSTLGTAVRLFTTYKEVGLELTLLLNFGLAFLTNAVMLIQYFVYRSNTEKFLESLKEKKQS